MLKEDKRYILGRSAKGALDLLGQVGSLEMKEENDLPDGLLHVDFKKAGKPIFCAKRLNEKGGNKF